MKFACEIKPSWSDEKKAVRLSLLDSLTEQLFRGKMVHVGDNQYEWEINRKLPVRINIIHKTSAFLFWGNRTLRLSSIIRSLLACASSNAANLRIYNKCQILAQFIQDQTKNWQDEVVTFLKNQVRQILHDLSNIIEKILILLSMF